MSRRGIESAMLSSELEEEAQKAEEAKEAEAEQQAQQEYNDFLEGLFGGLAADRDDTLAAPYLDKLRERAGLRLEALQAKGERVDGLGTRQIQYDVCKDEAARILAKMNRPESQDLKAMEKRALENRVLPKGYTLKELANKIYEMLRSRDDYVDQYSFMKGAREK